MRGWPALLLIVWSIAAREARADEASRIPFGIIIAEQARASFTIRGAGARAAGMGGAFTAVADDATAASFNPAGLAQLRVPEFSFVCSGERISDHYRNFISSGESPPLSLSDSSSSFRRNGFGFLSATLPFEFANKHWAVQLSRQRVVNFDYDALTKFFGDTRDDGIRFVSIQQQSLQNGSIDIISASLAVELTERMLFGVTFNKWAGDWTFTSRNARAAISDPSSASYFIYRQTSRLNATNLDLGLLLRYPRFRIGIRYRDTFTADYNFEGTTESNLPLSITGLPAFSSRLGWPQTINVGVTVSFSERWITALDWGRTDWRELRFDSGGGVFVSFFDLLERDRTRSEVSQDWRIGSEFLFFAGKTVIPLRIGLSREPQPARDVVTGERIVRTGISAGVGIKRGSFAADLTLSHRNSSTHVSRFFMPASLDSDNLVFNSFGTLEKSETTLIASIIMQIPPGTKLSRIFHGIFVGPTAKDR